jgi:hypothetical protein
MKTKRLFCAILFAFSIAFSAQAVVRSYQKVLGTWEFSAPSAPNPYSEGTIVLKEVDTKLTGELNIQGKKIAVKEVTFANDEMILKFEVENTFVTAKLKLVKGELAGNADSSSEGLIPVTAKLKK